MPIKGDNAEDCQRKTPHSDPDITQLTPISLIVVARVRYRCVTLTAKRLARRFNTDRTSGIIRKKKRKT